MQPSSTLCRAQESLQRSRASAALLDNVRIVAEKAAAAWGLEASAAEQREATHARTRAAAGIAAVQKKQPERQDERWFSENPDRGFVDH